MISGSQVADIKINHIYPEREMILDNFFKSLLKKTKIAAFNLNTRAAEAEISVNLVKKAKLSPKYLAVISLTGLDYI